MELVLVEATYLFLGSLADGVILGTVDSVIFGAY